MWYNSSFISYSIKILLGLLILSLSLQLLPNLYPILEFVQLFFSPLILGLVLYYIFRPIVSKMLELKLPFFAAIIFVFLFLGAVLALIATFLVPMVTTLQEVASAPTQKIEEVKEATLGFLNVFNLNLFSYDEIKGLITSYLTTIQTYLFSNTYNILSTITHVAFLFGITPFCLFYLLKDDQKFYSWLIEVIPARYRPQSEKTLHHLDQTLLTFFHGQIVVASAVTFMALIGLSLIGIDRLIFLVFLTFLLSLIPYMGTFIAIIPPLLVGLTTSYVMGGLAAAVMITIHLIEANLITPYVMMKRFDVHPLTVILLIVASFSFFGVTGPLWITPFYVFMREVIVQLYEFLSNKELNPE
jgi:predicted PurR-regulated permease PerM